MSSSRFIGSYLKTHWKQYVLGILTLLAVDYLNLQLPILTGNLTDRLNDGTLTQSGLKFLVIQLLSVGFGLALGRFFWRYFLFGASRQIEKEIRSSLFSHLETMSAEYYNHHKTGDLMAHFTNDLNAIRMALGPAVITAFDAVVFTAMVIFQMVFHINLFLTLLAVIPMSLIAGGVYLYGKEVKKRSRRRQEAYSDLTDQVQESISGIRVIKSFVQEDVQADYFSQSARDAMEANLSVAKLNSFIQPLMDFMIGISYLITLLYGGHLTLNGTISVGQFITFNQYLGNLVWPMIAVGDSVNLFSQGNASIQRLLGILQVQPDIMDRPNVNPQASVTGSLTLNHLTFAYPGEERQALRDISLHLSAGQTLAIIGRTGSGKTTLVNLLLHFFQVEDGMIFFDGQDINEIPLHVLREHIAYVPQDNFLFSDTLYENIAFGTDTPAKEAVYHAARMACIHENIMEFPEGYETVVGERGVTISGGQKQRSSIARALLKDAPILVLDDSLSAVDTDTEEQILKNLKQERSGKTTIMIAHRISTVSHADCILVLDEGQAVEIGTHAQLIRQGGLYASLFEKQQLEKQLAQEV